MVDKRRSSIKRQYVLDHRRIKSGHVLGGPGRERLRSGRRRQN